MTATPLASAWTSMATRSRSDSRSFAVFTARTSTTSLSQPWTSTVPFTFCNSNVPPGCSEYVWLNSLLMANPGTAAIANANHTIIAGTNSLRSLIYNPLRGLRTRIVSVRREASPSPEKRLRPKPRLSGHLYPFRPLKIRLSKPLVAQLELERDRRDYIHLLAVHPDRLAAPLLYRPH